MSESNDELKFAEEIDKLGPIVQTLSDLMSSNKSYLTRQKYAIDNNHLFIVGQQKEMAENKVIIDEAKTKAASIIAMAEDQSKVILSNAKARVGEINHMEREAKKKLEAADKVLFNATSKPVAA